MIKIVRDSEMKMKGKMYANEQRNVKQSNIKEGDKVVMKQKKKVINCQLHSVQMS